MKVGLFVPLVGDPERLPETLAVAATTAEAAGFHSLWFAEHVVLFDTHRSRYPYSEDGAFPIAGEDGLLEPFVAIAYAAAVTSRIRLGTGVCLVPQRSAIYTAKQVADCDVLSRGRIDFGVGIGWLREEFEALDMDFDDRAERCRESIGAMRSLWTDPLSSHDGALIRFPELRMFPKPVQKPHPPIVFGGDSDAALRRTADLGQGWYGFNQAPDVAAERVARLSGMLERRGRRRDDVEVSICPYLQPGLRGPDALHAYAEAGVDQVIHMAAGPDPASVRAEIERLASELLGVAGEIERRRRRAHVDV